MTMLMCDQSDRIRPLDEDLLVVTDSHTNQLLRYEDSISQEKIVFPTETTLFDEHPEMRVNYDMLDCYIDICSREILDLIADNYDYQSIRHDFVKNEVQNLDTGYKYYIYPIEASDYAARVIGLRTCKWESWCLGSLCILNIFISFSFLLCILYIFVSISFLLCILYIFVCFSFLLCILYIFVCFSFLLCILYLFVYSISLNIFFIPRCISDISLYLLLSTLYILYLFISSSFHFVYTISLYLLPST